VLALAIGCAFAAVLGAGFVQHLPTVARAAPGPMQADHALASRGTPAPALPRVAAADPKASRLAQPAHRTVAAAPLPIPRPVRETRVAERGSHQKLALGLPHRLFVPVAPGATSFRPSAAFRLALTESRTIALALPVPAPAVLVANTTTAEPVPVAKAEEVPVQLAMLEPSTPSSAMAGTPEAVLETLVPVPSARPRHRMKNPIAAAVRSAQTRRESAAPVLAYARPDAGDEDEGIPIGRSANVRPSRGVAVYDISAKMVYLPNGERLEAHSGLGALRDDPSFVHKKMRGATPPHTYNLALRESLFHGVRAIRLHPVGGQKAIHNRNGLLAHTYMLGKGGDSNGCVSIKDYKRFLAAYDRGEIRKLVVVARMSNNPIDRFASIFR
jgi:hypothetical protein